MKSVANHNLSTRRLRPTSTLHFILHPPSSHDSPRRHSAPRTHPPSRAHTHPAPDPPLVPLPLLPPFLHHHVRQRRKVRARPRPRHPRHRLCACARRPVPCRRGKGCRRRVGRDPREDLCWCRPWQEGRRLCRRHPSLQEGQAGRVGQEGYRCCESKSSRVDPRWGEGARREIALGAMVADVQFKPDNYLSEVKAQGPFLMFTAKYVCTCR